MNTFPNIDIKLASKYEIENNLKTGIWSDGDYYSSCVQINNKKAFHIIYSFLNLTKYTELLDFYNDNKGLPFYFTFKNFMNKQYICVFTKQLKASCVNNKFKIKVELEEI